MIRRRLTDIFSLDAAEESAVWESSNQLPVPTIDERAALYLRAIHAKHDFTEEEYSEARNLILDAMSADIASKMKVSNLPESVTPYRIAASFDASSEDTIEHQFQPHPLSPIETGGSSIRPVSPRAASALQAPYELSDQPDKSVELSLAQLQAAPPRRPSVKSPAWKSSKRSMSICAAAAIAASVVFFLVLAIPTSWFATDPNLSGSLSPRKPFEIKAEFAAPKQVETTAAPLGVDQFNTALIEGVPTHASDPEKTAELLKIARGLLVAGDIPAARSVLKPAAEAGDATAALELGATYDPIVLKELGVDRLSLRTIGTRAVKESGNTNLDTDSETIARDASMAKRWYQIAKDLGSAEASKRLERLSTVR